MCSFDIPARTFSRFIKRSTSAGLRLRENNNRFEGQMIHFQAMSMPNYDNK